MEFKIVSVKRVSDGQVCVRIRMDAKIWRKADKGALYGIDVSNEVFRQYGVKAYNPSVSDRDRASGGLKWIDLYYIDETWSEPPNNVIEVDFINKRRAA